MQLGGESTLIITISSYLLLSFVLDISAKGRDCVFVGILRDGDRRLRMLEVPDHHQIA